MFRGTGGHKEAASPPSTDYKKPSSIAPRQMRSNALQIGQRQDGMSNASPPALALQDTDNIHVHRQPSDTDPCKTIGASRALAAARQLMNSTGSALHRPPVSTPTTTSLQRSPANGSAYLRSFSLLTCNKTTPSVCDVFGTAAPDAVKTLRIVMSTANCAPWNNGRPLANTSMARSSLAETVTFMSRNLACHLTVVPASRHTRASVHSGPTARVRNLPDLGHAALCLPYRSTAPPHSHRFRHVKKGVSVPHTPGYGTTVAPDESYLSTKTQSPICSVRKMVDVFEMNFTSKGAQKLIHDGHLRTKNGAQGPLQRHHQNSTRRLPKEGRKNVVVGEGQKKSERRSGGGVVWQRAVPR